MIVILESKIKFCIEFVEIMNNAEKRTKMGIFLLFWYGKWCVLIRKERENKSVISVRMYGMYRILTLNIELLIGVSNRKEGLEK